MQAYFSQLAVGFVLNPCPPQAVLKIHLRLGLERANIVLSSMSTHIETKHSVKGFTKWKTQATTELYINSRIKGKCQSIINPLSTRQTKPNKSPVFDKIYVYIDQFLWVYALHNINSRYPSLRIMYYSRGQFTLSMGVPLNLSNAATL